ncbi:hypothetical protein COS16_01455, partial [Candidatus Desantisbacteria bacterium CG02_land_8_20_14_3_00_49_13]
YTQNEPVITFGNESPVYGISVTVDGSPPATALTIIGPKYEQEINGEIKTWITSAAQINLVSTDNLSGLNRIEYRTDNTALWNISTSPAAIQITKEGTHTLWFRGIDNVENIEQINSITLYVDNSAPVTDLNIGKPIYAISDTFITSSTPITLSSSDAGCGLKAIEYRIDESTWQAYSDPFTVPSGGRHTIYYRSFDNLNNEEMEGSAKTVTSLPDWQSFTEIDGVDIDASPGDVSIAGIPVWQAMCEFNKMPEESDPPWNSYISYGQYSAELLENCLHLSTSDPAVYTGWYRIVPEFSSEIGSTVEARLKVVTTDDYPGDIRIFLIDGSCEMSLGFKSNSVCMGYGDAGFTILTELPFNTTDGFHTYRLTLKQGTANLYIDNNPVPVLTQPGIGYSDRFIFFGDYTYQESFDSGQHSEVWDYVRYTAKGAFAPSPVVQGFIRNKIVWDGIPSYQGVFRSSGSVPEGTDIKYEISYSADDISYTQALEIGNGAVILPGYKYGIIKAILSSQNSGITPVLHDYTLFYPTGHKSTTVIVDDIPPVTSISCGSPAYFDGADTWITPATVFHLSCADQGIDTPSGTAITLYRINGGMFRPTRDGFSPKNCGTDRCTIEFYGVDNLSNAEQVRSYSARVDTTPPSVDVSTGTPSYTANAETYIGPLTKIYLLPSDSGCGPETVSYQVDTGPILPYTLPFSIISGGKHSISWYAWDKLGNFSTSGKRVFTSLEDWQKEGAYSYNIDLFFTPGDVRLMPAAVYGYHISSVIDLGKIPEEDGLFSADFQAGQNNGIQFEYSHANITSAQDWQWAQEIIINNPAGSALEEYQALVELTASDFDYSKARPDGSDIRFQDSDKITFLPYYIDTWNPSGISRIWVKVPYIPANSSKSVYILYGNLSAESESSGESVFLAFDDFNDNSWQDKWVLDSAGPGAPQITEHYGYLDIPSWFGGGQNLTSCFDFLSQPILIESRMLHFESYESQSILGLKQGHYILGFGNNGYENRGFYLEDYAGRGLGAENWAGGNAYGVWKCYRILADGNNFDGWRGDADGIYDQFIDWDFGNSYDFNTTGPCNARIYIWRSGILLDWFRIRKYAQTEPAVIIDGEERQNDWSEWTTINSGETLPAGYRFYRVRTTLSSDAASEPVLHSYELSFEKPVFLNVDNTAPSLVITVPPEAGPDPVQVSVQASEELKAAPEVRVTQNGMEGWGIVPLAYHGNSLWTGQYQAFAGYNGKAQIEVTGQDLAGHTGTSRSEFMVNIPSLEFSFDNVWDEPDPFNPPQQTAKIHFTVSNPGTYIGFVFLFDDMQNQVNYFRYDNISGPYQVEWNGMDEMGNMAREGVYTYRFTALTAEEQAIDKMGKITLLNMASLDTSGAGIYNPGNPQLQIIPYTPQHPAVAGAFSTFNPQGLAPISSIYNLQPEGTLFDPPARFTIRYTDADAEIVGEDNLWIYMFDEGGNSWAKVEPQYKDKDSNTITIYIDHLSLYSLLFSKTEVNITPPIAEITDPIHMSFVANNVEIKGTANAMLFGNYRFDYGAGAFPDTWTLIEPVYGYPVESSTLTIWNTTGLEGIYTLRLTVANRIGDTASTQVTVIIDNTKPTTTTLTIGEPKYDYTNGTPVVVTSHTPFVLTCLDSGLMPSGILQSEYAVDTDASWTLASYSGEDTLTGAQLFIFTIPDAYLDAEHAIYYRSVDNAGNFEDSKSITIVLDNTSPAAALAYPSKQDTGICKIVNSNTMSIIGTTTDIHFSLYRIELKAMRDGDTPTDWTTINEAELQKETQSLGVWNTTQFTKNRWYYIRIVSTDKVNNTSIDTVSVYLGNPEVKLVFGSHGNDNGDFKEPYGIAFSPTQEGSDNSGCIFVTDNKNDRVQKFDINGKFLLSFNGRSGESHKLKKPSGIAVDPESACVFVADRDNDRIQAFDLFGNFLFSFGEKHDIKRPEQLSVGLYYTYQDTSYACTKAVYVADAKKDRIAIFDYEGNLLATISNLDDPQGVFALDHLQYPGSTQAGVYVANTDDNIVTVYTSALTPTFSIKGLDDPRAVYADQRGYIYVSDTDHNKIKRYNRYGELLMQYSGSCTTSLDKPAGICLDNQGNLWIADEENNRIVKIGAPTVDETMAMRMFSLPKAAMTIKDAYAFPVPFKPNSGLGHTAISFKLYSTLNVLLRIYNISGELVFEQTGITTDPYIWNVLNNWSEPIASGVYIYFLTDSTLERKIGKIMIIR